MLVSEAIQLIRERTNDEYDTGYKDAALINYINDAIKYLAGALIARNDPVLTKVMDINQNTTNKVPKNFVRFAGGFPVIRMGMEFQITESVPQVTVKYFYMPDNITATTEEMPFKDNDTYDMIVVNMATIYALNKHEYNVEQDNALHNQLNEIITSALGAVT